MPKHEISKATDPFTCGTCEAKHPAGTRALFDKGKLSAADCWFNKIPKSNANPKSIESNRQGTKAQESAGNADHLNGAPLPISLTDKQIQQFWLEAQAEAMKVGAMTDMLDVAIALMNAKLQKQAQEFSIASMKHIEQTKSENIRRVKYGD